MTSAGYLEMFTNFVIPNLKKRNDLSDVLLMQHDAPPDVEFSVKRFLKQHSDDRIISRHFTFLWPPRSPDLIPMDLWLWGYLKSKCMQLVCKLHLIRKISSAVQRILLAMVHDFEIVPLSSRDEMCEEELKMYLKTYHGFE